jgi:hypothetical protein
VRVVPYDPRRPDLAAAACAALAPLFRWDNRNERILRDHLRADPEGAARYAELKRGLAAAGLGGEEYTRAKTALIQELTDLGRAARGLPSVPVWE